MTDTVVVSAADKVVVLQSNLSLLQTIVVGPAGPAGPPGPSSFLSVENPLMAGIADPGVAIIAAREDHVHPSDTAKVTVGDVTTITSISGMTTALSVAQGGTGATTLTGLVKGTGTTAMAAATAGTDYVAPGIATLFSAIQRPALVQATASVGTSHTWDLSLAQTLELTYGAGNITLLGIYLGTAGAFYALRLKQDAVGARTLAWSPVFKWPGATAPTLSTGANAVDVLTFYYDGSAMYSTGVSLGVA